MDRRSLVVLNDLDMGFIGIYLSLIYANKHVVTVKWIYVPLFLTVQAYSACTDIRQKCDSDYLQHLCQTYPDVSGKVHNAMGDVLYERFMVKSRTL